MTPPPLLYRVQTLTGCGEFQTNMHTMEFIIKGFAYRVDYPLEMLISHNGFLTNSRDNPTIMISTYMSKRDKRKTAIVC